MSGRPTDPNGCHYCGVVERDHYTRWDPVARWHQWVQPEQWQILDRMRDRRATSTADSTEVTSS